jgi:YD repeat-containing protein
MSQFARPQAITGSSWISNVPISAPESMPWGWNPAATFLTAYYDAQKEKRAQQEFQAAQEMDQILFPIKQQQAMLSLEKMQLEMERTKGEIERQRILTRQETDVTRNNNRGFNDGLTATTQTPSRRAAIDWNAWGNPSAQQTSDDLIP